MKTLFLLGTSIFLISFVGCDVTPPQPGTSTSDPYVTATQPLANPATVDHQPVVIRYVEAAYPRFAKDAGLDGTVIIFAHITELGEVDSVKVDHTSGTASLDEAAMKAAREYKYKPAFLDGHPVDCWVTYSVTFDLP